eukprot:8931442-Alexandrium_andersonii.AAC.1
MPRTPRAPEGNLVASGAFGLAPAPEVPAVARFRLRPLGGSGCLAGFCTRARAHSARLGFGSSDAPIVVTARLNADSVPGQLAPLSGVGSCSWSCLSSEAPTDKRPSSGSRLKKAPAQSSSHRARVGISGPGQSFNREVSLQYLLAHVERRVLIER